MAEFAHTKESEDARITDCDLSGAQCRNVNLSNVKITDAWLFNTDIYAAIGGLTINRVLAEPPTEASSTG